MTTTTVTSTTVTTTTNGKTTTAKTGEGKLPPELQKQFDAFVAKAQAANAAALKQVTSTPPPSSAKEVEEKKAPEQTGMSADEAPVEDAPAEETPAEKVPAKEAAGTPPPADDGDSADESEGAAAAGSGGSEEAKDEDAPKESAAAEGAEGAEETDEESTGAAAGSGDGDGDETVGNGQDNVLQARPGGDTVRGLGGNDEITDGDGDDTISGGKGDDEVFLVKGGTNTVTTGSGDDRVFAGDGNNTIRTFSGEDFVQLDGGINTVETGTESDDVAVFGGQNTINTGAGEDRVSLFGGTNDVTLGADADTVGVIGGNNVIRGNANDTVFLDGSASDYEDPTDGENGGTLYVNRETGASTEVVGAQVDFTDNLPPLEPASSLPPLPRTEDGVITLDADGPFDRGVYEGTEEADTFNINGGDRLFILGRDGDDTFNVNGGITAAIAGDEGADTFNMNGGEVGTLRGGTGADTFNLNGGTVRRVEGDGEDRAVLAGGRADYIDPDPQPADNGFRTFERTDGTGQFTIESGVEVLFEDELEEGAGGPDNTPDTGAGTQPITIDTPSASFLELPTGQENSVIINADTPGVLGGDLADNINANAGNFGTLAGNDDNDIFTINGGSGRLISGGAGDDRFNLNGGTVDRVSGGAGTDTAVLAGSAADYVDPDPQPAENGDLTFVRADGGGSFTVAEDVDIIRFGDGTFVRGGPDDTDQPNILNFTPGNPNGGEAALNRPNAFTVSTTVPNPVNAGNLADSFTFADGASGEFNGLDGVDTFTVNGGTNLRLNGGEGNDIYNLNGGRAVIRDEDGTAILAGNRDDFRITQGNQGEVFVSPVGADVDTGDFFNISEEVAIQFADGSTFDGVFDEESTATPTPGNTGGGTTSGGGNQQAPLIERRGTDNSFVQPFEVSDDARAENAGGATFLGDDQDNTITLVRGTGTVIGRGGEDTVIIDGQASDFRTEDVRITDGNGTQQATRYIRNDGTADFIIADDVENTLFQDVGPNTTPPGVSVTPVETPDGGNGGVDGGNNGGGNNGGGSTSGGITVGTLGPVNTFDGDGGSNIFAPVVSGSNRIRGNGGDDIITISGGDRNSALGGIGDDIFNVEGGTNNLLNGNEGDDVFNISGGDNRIFNGGGQDTVNFEGSRDDYEIEEFDFLGDPAVRYTRIDGQDGENTEIIGRDGEFNYVINFLGDN